MPSGQVIVVTGASSGFGQLTIRAEFYTRVGIEDLLSSTVAP